jgi:hypothetical protein
MIRLEEEEESRVPFHPFLNTVVSILDIGQEADQTEAERRLQITTRYSDFLIICIEIFQAQ